MKFAPDKPVVEIASVEARKDDKEALSPIKEKCGYIIFILVTVALIFQSKLGVETWVICFTGAHEAVGAILANVAGKMSSPYLIGLVFFVVPFLLTQIMMNRTVMLIFIPIAILACKSLNANPIGIIILVQSACLSSFMTPMATPAVPYLFLLGENDWLCVDKKNGKLEYQVTESIAEFLQNLMKLYQLEEKPGHCCIWGRMRFFEEYNDIYDKIRYN